MMSKWVRHGANAVLRFDHETKAERRRRKFPGWGKHRSMSRRINRVKRGWI